MSFRDKNLRFANHLNVAPEVFSQTSVLVELPAASAARQGNVAAFVLALNCIARTFEDVYAAFPEGLQLKSHPWNVQTIDEAVEEINLVAEGSIRVNQPCSPDIALSIAAKTSASANRTVAVSGTEWSAALDCEMESAGEGFLGSLYAATMGAAQVLLHALDLAGAEYAPMPPTQMSLLDYSPIDQAYPPLASVALPDSHLVGVGAVGSACLYALGHLDDISGTVHLIDNEAVDEGNLNRYILMRRADLGRHKVDVGHEAFHSSGIRPVPHTMAFRDYEKQADGKVDLMLTPVDSEEARCSLAKSLPRRVINAATGGTTVTISTHGFGDGKACLNCLYKPKPGTNSRAEIVAQDTGLPVQQIEHMVEANLALDAETIAAIESFRDVRPGTWADHIGMPVYSFYDAAFCGDAELQLPTDSIIAPLSFISCAAGILLAAELVKVGNSALSSHRLDNYFRLDTLAPPNPDIRRTKRPHPSAACICKEPDYLDAYRSKYPSHEGEE